jgi:hypothetical protein
LSFAQAQKLNTAGTSPGIEIDTPRHRCTVSLRLHPDSSVSPQLTDSRVSAFSAASIADRSA